MITIQFAVALPPDPGSPKAYKYTDVTDTRLIRKTSLSYQHRLNRLMLICNQYNVGSVDFRNYIHWQVKYFNDSVVGGEL